MIETEIRPLFADLMQADFSEELKRHINVNAFQLVLFVHLFLSNCKHTTAHFIAIGLPSQQNRSDNAFRFKRAAFYMGLKSKVGLVAAQASALRINLNIQDCSIVAPPLHAPSRAPLLLPLLQSHNIPLPRVH